MREDRRSRSENAAHLSRDACAAGLRPASFSTYARFETKNRRAAVLGDPSVRDFELANQESVSRKELITTSELRLRTGYPKGQRSRSGPPRRETRVLEFFVYLGGSALFAGRWFVRNGCELGASSIRVWNEERRKHNGLASAGDSYHWQKFHEARSFAVHRKM